MPEGQLQISQYSYLFVVRGSSMQHQGAAPLSMFLQQFLNTKTTKNNQTQYVLKISLYKCQFSKNNTVFQYQNFCAICGRYIDGHTQRQLQFHLDTLNRLLDHCICDSEENLSSTTDTSNHSSLHFSSPYNLSHLMSSCILLVYYQFTKYLFTLLNIDS